MGPHGPKATPHMTARARADRPPGCLETGRMTGRSCNYPKHRHASRCASKPSLQARKWRRNLRQHRGSTTSKDISRGRDLIVVDRLRPGRGPGRRERPAVAPRHVGRHHRGRDLATARRRDRSHRILAQVTTGPAGVDLARHGTRERLDVGLPWRVVADVAGGVGPDDVHDRAAGSAGVMQIGQTVGQARTKVQQHRGRPAIRAYPSAAPVATPSNNASTPRISGTESRAATKCISDLPGFMKHTSTPAPTRLPISACAPIMARS